jgi:hypothetical protein
MEVRNKSTIYMNGDNNAVTVELLRSYDGSAPDATLTDRELYISVGELRIVDGKSKIESISAPLSKDDLNLLIYALQQAATEMQRECICCSPKRGK